MTALGSGATTRSATQARQPSRPLPSSLGSAGRSTHAAVLVLPLVAVLSGTAGLQSRLTVHLQPPQSCGRPSFLLALSSTLVLAPTPFGPARQPANNNTRNRTKQPPPVLHTVAWHFTPLKETVKVRGSSTNQNINFDGFNILFHQAHTQYALTSEFITKQKTKKIIFQ